MVLYIILTARSDSTEVKMNKEDNSKECLSESDDRVIADMNIDGMPWHSKGIPVYPESKEPLPPLSPKELFKITFHALGAALVIGFIFIFAFYLFIEFCIHVWFK